jgi:hypothetical protein
MDAFKRSVYHKFTRDLKLCHEAFRADRKRKLRLWSMDCGL